MTILKYHHYRYITYGFVMLCRKYRVPTPKKNGKKQLMAICSRKTTSPASPFCPAASAKKRVARLSVPMRPMMLMAPGNASRHWARPDRILLVKTTMSPGKL